MANAALVVLGRQHRQCAPQLLARAYTSIHLAEKGAVLLATGAFRYMISASVQFGQYIHAAEHVCGGVACSAAYLGVSSSLGFFRPNNPDCGGGGAYAGHDSRFPHAFKCAQLFVSPIALLQAQQSWLCCYRTSFLICEDCNAALAIRLSG